MKGCSIKNIFLRTCTYLAKLNHDILGYVDKTIEANVEIIEEQGNKFTLEDIDIYPDIYKDSKVRGD